MCKYYVSYYCNHINPYIAHKTGREYQRFHNIQGQSDHYDYDYHYAMMVVEWLWK